ncbi:hypothetical protein BH11VER1_BH11VER1_03590 [soil metagenome]
MEQLPHAKGFWELIVYQRARELQRQVFECSKAFPKAEAYSLTDQMRRAGRSIGAQIAEAWGKRTYEKHFVSKLTDAGSLPPSMPVICPVKTEKPSSNSTLKSVGCFPRCRRNRENSAVMLPLQSFARPQLNSSLTKLAYSLPKHLSLTT